MAQITLNSTGVASNGSLVLQSNGTTSAVTIDASQNVGIALTPSAWRAGGGNLEINATTNGYIAINNGGGGILQNAYRDASNFVYKNTGTASYFNMTGDGVFAWNRAASGTAGNAITFTQAMTLSAAGNLGIGTTSPSDTSSYGRALDIQSSTGAAIYLRDSDGPTTSYGVVAYDASIDSLTLGSITASTGIMRLITAGSERARIDSSGNLLVGTTSAGLDKVRISSAGASSNQLGLVSNDDGTGNGYIIFRNAAATAIGSITRVGTTNAVAYNTTSDYRLKTVTGAVTGQGARIDALKPIDYLWTDGGQQARGFLAHEFQTVYLNSVTGTKDAVDADGKPVYQSMQAATSEVIADLVAEIQSLRTRVAQLESN